MSEIQIVLLLHHSPHPPHPSPPPPAPILMPGSRPIRSDMAPIWKSPSNRRRVLIWYKHHVSLVYFRSVHQCYTTSQVILVSRVVDLDNPLKFSFRCPTKCANDIYSHRSHMSALIEFANSLLLIGSKEMKWFFCFVPYWLVLSSFPEPFWAGALMGEKWYQFQQKEEQNVYYKKGYGQAGEQRRALS